MYERFPKFWCKTVSFINKLMIQFDTSPLSVSSSGLCFHRQLFPQYPCRMDPLFLANGQECNVAFPGLCLYARFIFGGTAEQVDDKKSYDKKSYIQQVRFQRHSNAVDDEKCILWVKQREEVTLCKLNCVLRLPWL